MDAVGGYSILKSRRPISFVKFFYYWHYIVVCQASEEEHSKKSPYNDRRENGPYIRHLNLSTDNLHLGIGQAAWVR
jgi:hypothetical protein